LALPRSLQVAVKLLIEGKPTEDGILAGWLWGELHLERTGSSHLGFLG
jgi:hypothetical protein